MADVAEPHRAGAHPELPPPTASVGTVGWLRRNLFSSPLNSALTLAALYLLYLVIPPLVDWAILQANWGPGSSRAACTLPAG
jgi:general L-amino acid transport system permease protein